MYLVTRNFRNVRPKFYSHASGVTIHPIFRVSQKEPGIERFRTSSNDPENFSKKYSRRKKYFQFFLAPEGGGVISHKCWKFGLGFTSKFAQNAQKFPLRGRKKAGVLKYFSESNTLFFFTDSKYVKEGIESWIHNWKKNGWKTTAKKPVKNKELWMELDEQITKHTINWQWVKGHAGNIHNETADYLARKFIEDS